jgi:hypothetical protein
MHIPRRIIEHPLEAAIAGLLLLGLLFGSADLKPSAKASSPPPAAVAQKS